MSRSNRTLQIYLPYGVSAGDLLPYLASKNVVAAGGLHALIKGLIHTFAPHLTNSTSVLR